MSLKRVAKTLAASFSGQGLNVLAQLLLPPIFLRHYSVSGYGEWLTLSATVGYLGTLNFGLQTYANNQVAICYHRGDLDEARTIQATALVLLLGVVGATALITAVVFLVPINQWLGLKASHMVVSTTIYLLGLQVLLKMIYGFLVGTFLVVGISYRGQHWNNAQMLVTTLATAAQATCNASFSWIAAQQLITTLTFSLIVLIDLRIKAAPVFPRLRHLDPKRFGAVLEPSGYFGMLFCANFLVYQLPVILMQRILGPTAVVVFSLTRTIYSMARQGLAILSQAIGPEINELYAQRNWSRLFRLYELSERVVFALTPIATIGTMLATPVLMTVWLHKPSLYDPAVCIVMGLISGIMGVKEHKYIFQTSSNEHPELARLTFWSYLVMVVLAVPAVRWFGILGFSATWFATEIYQTLSILRLNLRLFSGTALLDFSPVYKLFALMIAATLLGSWFAFAAPHRTWLQELLTALTFAIVLAAISYPLFGLSEVRRDLRVRFGLA
ncbi:MAG: lipopolysaccharide biosynthesis protein [Terracidiphilus sp.]